MTSPDCRKPTKNVEMTYSAPIHLESALEIVTPHDDHVMFVTTVEKRLGSLSERYSKA